MLVLSCCVVIVFMLFFQYYDKEFMFWDWFEVKGLRDDGSEMIMQDFFDYFEVIQRILLRVVRFCKMQIMIYEVIFVNY